MRFRLFALLVFAAGPAAADWNPTLASFSGVTHQVDEISKPLTQVYFNPTKFEQDELGSELAVLNTKLERAREAQECDCADPTEKKKNWIATFHVSGSLIPPRFLEVESEIGEGLKPYAYNPYWVDFHHLIRPLKDQSRLTSAEMTADILDYFKSQPVVQGIDFRSFEKEIFQGITHGRVLKTPNDQQWRDALREAGQRWNRNEIISFIRMVGSKMGGNYDFARADGGEAGRGSVTVPQLMAGLREGIPAGVCRDIASAQGEMLELMGVKNVYVMAYGATGPHATVIATDPENPRRILAFNYSDGTTSSDHLGVNALRQWEDRGIAYQLYKPGGKLMAQAPSELGNMLNQASGANLREIDVFTRLDSPYMASMKASRGSLMVNAFTGRLTNGSTIVGVASQKRFGDPSEEKATTEVAGVYAKQAGGVDDLDVNHVMTRVTQTLNTPWVRFNESLRARFETSAQGVLDSTVTGWLNANAGVRVERKTADSKLGVRAGTQFSGGAQDIRDSFQVGMFHNLSYASVDGEKKLSPEWTGVLDAAVGFRHFGPQAMVSAGVRHERSETTIRAGIEGAFRDEVPTVMPGMARAVTAQVETEKAGWLLSARYVQPLSREGRGNPTLQGSATKGFGKKK